MTEVISLNMKLRDVCHRLSGCRALAHVTYSPTESLECGSGKKMATFLSYSELFLGIHVYLFVFVLKLRNAHHSLGDLSSTEDWWDWTLSTLLDGLHPERMPATAWGSQVRPFPICRMLHGSEEKPQCRVGAAPWCHGRQRNLLVFLPGLC